MQRILKFIKVSFSSLLENKSRSFLTMLGIIIGIGSVILMVSVGKGAESLILSSIQSFGNKSIFVHPGGGNQAASSHMTSVDKVKYKDYLAMRNLDYIEDVTPMLVYSTVVSYQSESQKVAVVGTNENYVKSINSDVLRGRFLSLEDQVNSARVAVIGYKNADKLFGDQDPIGKNVKIGGKNFQVIGLMEVQGTRFFQDFDERVLVPISTMRNELYGVDYVMAIMANAKGNIQDAIDDLTVFIRKRHAINNPENDPQKDDFMVVSQMDAADIFKQVSGVLTMFLVAIAAISLLVGGIGIMNIMLVAVSERTREIGLRKAVGANNSDIMLQFLIESAVITFIAGALGVLGGILSSWLISIVLVRFQPDWRFIVTTDSVLVAFGVSVMIGLLFGIYPARSASKLDPIECLRSE
jgi:putative ABC transport system permease protein